MSVEYQVELATHIKEIYNDLFLKTLESWDSIKMNYIKQKSFEYHEKIYKHNKNPIWSDFFKNPR